MSQAHELTATFPQHKERIHELKMSDGHFRKLHEQYDEVSKELHRIEAEVETPEDAYVEQLKKKRLALLDEIARMLAVSAA